MNGAIKYSQMVRVIIGIIVMISIAAIHWFRIGSYLDGDLYILYYSYASDIIIPFGFYFLLNMNEINFRFLQKWYVKAIIVFGLSTLTEIMQLFGIYFLGVTFDTIDILMFGIGTLLAVLFDKIILEKAIPFWKYNLVDKKHL